MGSGRKSIDCRDYPSEKKCSLAMSGTEEDITEVAVQHAVTRHGHEDTPQFRAQLRSMLKDDER